MSELLEISDSFLDGLRDEILNEKLILPDVKPHSSKSVTVIPKPGFCIKIKDEGKGKIFINICTSENVPLPKPVTDDEILRLTESEDIIAYKVPLSLGEPHAEFDKSGQGCTVYDVVVNPNFYEEALTREILMGFFLSVTLEGLENKYKIKLNRDFTILKNRKFIGTLTEQNIRQEKKPWIMEMEEEKTTDNQEKKKAPQPVYTLIQEPAEGHPEYIVGEIHLPNIKTAAGIFLDIGEDRIVLDTRSNAYFLDIFLPYFLEQDSCLAQFNRKTQILSLTLPVQKNV